MRIPSQSKSLSPGSVPSMSVAPAIDHLYYQENLFDKKVPPWDSRTLGGHELRKGGFLKVPFMLSQGRAEESEWRMETSDDRVLRVFPQAWMPYGDLDDGAGLSRSACLRFGLVRRAWRSLPRENGQPVGEALVTLRCLSRTGEDNVQFRLFL